MNAFAGAPNCDFLGSHIYHVAQSSRNLLGWDRRATTRPVAKRISRRLASGAGVENKLETRVATKCLRIVGCMGCLLCVRHWRHDKTGTQRLSKSLAAHVGRGPRV